MKLTFEMGTVSFGQVVISMAEALGKLEPDKFEVTKVCDTLNKIPDGDCIKFPGGEVICENKDNTTSFTVNIEDDAVLRFTMPLLSKTAEILAGPYLTAKALLCQLRPLTDNLKAGYRMATLGFRHKYEKPSKYAVMLIGNSNLNVIGSVVVVRKDGYGNAPKIIMAKHIDKDLGYKYIKAQVDAVYETVGDELFDLETRDDAVKNMQGMVTQCVLNSKWKTNSKEKNEISECAPVPENIGNTNDVGAPSADSMAMRESLEKIVNPFNEGKSEAPKPRRKHRGGRRRHRNKPNTSAGSEANSSPEKTSESLNDCTYAVYVFYDTCIAAPCEDLLILRKSSDGTISLVNREHISGVLVPNLFILEAAVLAYKKKFDKLYFGVDSLSDATEKFDTAIKAARSSAAPYLVHGELVKCVDVIYTDYQAIKQKDIQEQGIRISTEDTNQ